MDADQLISNISEYIVNPVIGLLFVTALLVFFWGIFELISHADDESAREKGRGHMIYGTVGIFIMVSVYGLLEVIKQFVTK